MTFSVPTGNFGDIFAGYAATRMGLPIAHAGRRHQRQRHPRAHASQTGRYEPREVAADHQPQHGHPDLVQLRAPAVRGRRPRSAPRRATQMQSLATTGRFIAGPGRARRPAQDFPGCARRRGRDVATSAASGEPAAISPIRTPPSASPPPQGRAQRRRAHDHARHRPPGQIPRCRRSATGDRAARARHARRAAHATGARHGASQRPRRGRRVRLRP